MVYMLVHWLYGELSRGLMLCRFWTPPATAAPRERPVPRRTRPSGGIGQDLREQLRGGPTQRHHQNDRQIGRSAQRGSLGVGVRPLPIGFATPVSTPLRTQGACRAVGIKPRRGRSKCTHRYGHTVCRHTRDRSTAHAPIPRTPRRPHHRSCRGFRACSSGTSHDTARRGV